MQINPWRPSTIKISNKVAEFRNESPHRSGKETPKFVTPKSLCFIHQKKLQELPRQVHDPKIGWFKADKDL